MPRFTPEQKARRNALYNYYRNLGFSSQESREMRDESARTRLDNIASRRQQLESRQQTNATQQRIQVMNSEENRLIRETREQRKARPSIRPAAARRGRRPIIRLPEELDFISDEIRGTASENKQNFSAWSSRFNGFPPEIQSFIERENMRNNRMRNSSFGYRVFYRMYTDGWTEEKASSVVRDMIDRGVGSNQLG
jgi:hypothetical protein